MSLVLDVKMLMKRVAALEASHANLIDNQNALRAEQKEKAKKAVRETPPVAVPAPAAPSVPLLVATPGHPHPSVKR